MTHLHAGSATVDVTPDGPVPMSGYGDRDGPSTGVHDPLEASALALSDGAVTVGVVSVDLLNVSRPLVAAVRRALAADGIQFDELVVAATHTHAGPYVDTPALAMDSVLREEAEVSDLRDSLADGVATSLARARERLEPASIRIGRTDLEEIQTNRRAEGGVGGNVRMPAGRVDPELVALLVETTSGRDAVVYNFACHPVCTTGEETLLSADWPGYARRRVREERPDADVLYLNGAAGDINPRESSENRTHDAVYEYMDRIGTSVGTAVLEAVDDAQRRESITAPTISFERRELALRLKATPPRADLEERLTELEATMADCEDAGDDVGREKVYWDWRYVRTLLDIDRWGARSVEAPMLYVELGGVGLLSIPGEALVEHGFEFKARAGADVLLPVGYANEYVGYLPTLSDLETGGYEVRMAKVAPEEIVEFREAAFDLVE